MIAGTLLGRYEIQSPLGAGGMGEVYRARDTVLDRTVAVKILPPHLTDQPAARQRLEREARAISSLNHPNICTLHDVGHQDGVDFLVMECLDGETLADRLARGPLPLDQVFKYGLAICEGLERAHQGGVIHRDLKPSNIMLTKSSLKLMDFGLAKAAPAVQSTTDVTVTSPAGGAPLTASGVVVGTCQYMSPEQIEGKEADAASDIFALGAIFYEMATGKRAFDGKTTASVIAAVLAHDPPPISTSQPLSPPALDRLVQTCLSKDPGRRWHAAHDVGLELQYAAEGASALDKSKYSAGRSRMHRVAWAIAALMTAAAAVLAIRSPSQSPRVPDPVRASIAPPDKAAFAPFNFTLSPDGSRLAFESVADDGSTALWIRDMRTGVTRKYPNTDDARFPFWSPDSLQVGFFAEGRLKTLDLGGGAVQTLCAARNGLGGDWNRDGVIVFAGFTAGPIQRVLATGGEPTPVTTVATQGGAEGHRWPAFLPDGKHFIYQVGWVASAGTYIGSLDGGEPLLVSHDLLSNVQFASGYLIYVRAGGLVAQPFDPDRLRTTGDPLPLAPQDVEFERAFLHGNFSVSKAGVLVFLSRAASLPEFEWFDRAGAGLGTTGVSGAYEPHLSPNGRSLAYSAEPDADGKHNIWIYDLVRKTATQLTDGDRDGFPLWSPDGARLVYGGYRSSEFTIGVRAADGSGESRVLEQGIFMPPTDWSRDGMRILFMNVSKGAPRIYARNVDGSGTPEALMAGSEAQFSPDGRWVAYTGDPGEVFMQPYPAGAGRLQVSNGGGAQPRWRADGKELFYIARDKKLMSVSIEEGPQLAAGVPHALFQTRITGARYVYFQYDVAPDGQRFLINSLKPGNSNPPLTLLVNWTAQLKN